MTCSHVTPGSTSRKRFFASMDLMSVMNLKSMTMPGLFGTRPHGIGV
jgi:hypothetical protein